MGGCSDNDGRSAADIALGASEFKAAELLAERCGSVAGGGYGAGVTSADSMLSWQIAFFEAMQRGREPPPIDPHLKAAEQDTLALQQELAEKTEELRSTRPAPAAVASDGNLDVQVREEPTPKELEL